MDGSGVIEKAELERQKIVKSEKYLSNEENDKYHRDACYISRPLGRLIEEADSLNKPSELPEPPEPPEENVESDKIKDDDGGNHESDYNVESDKIKDDDGDNYDKNDYNVESDKIKDDDGHQEFLSKNHLDNCDKNDYNVESDKIKDDDGNNCYKSDYNVESDKVKDDDSGNYKSDYNVESDKIKDGNNNRNVNNDGYDSTIINLTTNKADDKRNSDDFGDNVNDDGVSIKRQNKKFSRLRKIFNIRKKQ
nr:199_t:CDS:2 [Entrophospora candida]